MCATPESQKATDPLFIALGERNGTTTHPLVAGARERTAAGGGASGSRGAAGKKFATGRNSTASKASPSLGGNSTILTGGGGVAASNFSPTSSKTLLGQ